MPQVIVIDEIGTELEAAAARTIAERGVQLVATAHGNSLGNLLVNPTLSDLVGGIQTVTLGDEEARRRHTQKSIQERKAPPTFEVVVEQQSWDEATVHRDVADTVDNMLRGQNVVAEERTRDEDTGQVTIRRITQGSMEIPGWGADARQFQGITTSMFERNAGNSGSWGGQLRQVGSNRDRTRNQGPNTGLQQVRALAPTGTAPADVAPRSSLATATALATGIDPATDEQPAVQLSTAKTLRVYPFGVNRDRLAQSARQLHVPVVITNNEREADAVMTLKNYYRRQPERLNQAEQEHKLIIILKNNTVAQMQHALARIFNIPEQTTEADNQEETENTAANNQTPVDPTQQALLETEDAIHQVLNKGLTTAELPPANAYIRRLQHQMATRYNLLSRSRGKEPNRRVKIFRAHE
jgi:hypothetical protein